MKLGGRVNASVLVVDDDRAVREVIARILEDEGYQVWQAANGAEGLAMVRELRPHAVVLDVMMPVMDGQGFLRELRQDPLFAQTRVVVTTAMRGVTSKHLAALGGDDVLPKPFGADELLNKIALATFRASALRQERQAPPRRPANTIPPPTSERGVVLVVDDDRHVLGAIEALLSDEGYSVIPVAKCDDTLPRLARVLEPAAVIVDLSMPNVDGMTVLRWLRSEPALDHVPILMISGDDRALEARRAEISGFGAALTPKPLSPSALLEFLDAPPENARRAVG